MQLSVRNQALLALEIEALLDMHSHNVLVGEMAFWWTKWCACEALPHHTWPQQVPL